MNSVLTTRKIQNENKRVQGPSGSPFAFYTKGWVDQLLFVFIKTN